MMVEIDPSQSRAARGLLSWSQYDLEAKSGVGQKTINDFELGKRTPRPDTLAKLRAALEKAGVEFIAENGGGPGVRLRKRGKR